MKRNLRFWTRFTWESTGGVLIAVATLCVISLLGASSAENLWDLAAALPYYLFWAAGISILILNTSVQMLYIPALLSFGETRRNVFLGFNYYRVLIIAVSLGLSALIWALLPGGSSGLRILPTMAVALLLISSVGSLIGTVYVKWKWVGFVLMVVLGGAFGGVIGFVSVGDGLQNLLVELATLPGRLPLWLVLAAGIALALDLIFHWLLLRRREVKL